MWNIDDYLSTKGQDPPNNQQVKVYLFYKPSIFYTHFKHLNMLEEKQSRKSRVPGFDVALGKMIFRKTQVRVRGNWVKMTERWGHIEGKRDIVWVIEGDFLGSIRVRVIRINTSYSYSAREAHFWYNSLPFLCMTTTWNFQKLSNYTFCGGNVACVPFCFFLHCCSFSPWWPLAFLIFSLPQ